MFKVQVAGVNEEHWSENALTFETDAEARNYAFDLLGRWMGADLARVVPIEVPRGEAVDLDDLRIVINYRR